MKDREGLFDILRSIAVGRDMSPFDRLLAERMAQREEANVELAPLFRAVSYTLVAKIRDLSPERKIPQFRGKISFFHPRLISEQGLITIQVLLPCHNGIFYGIAASEDYKEYQEFETRGQSWSNLDKDGLPTNFTKISIQAEYSGSSVLDERYIGLIDIASFHEAGPHRRDRRYYFNARGIQFDIRRLHGFDTQVDRPLLKHQDYFSRKPEYENPWLVVYPPLPFADDTKYHLESLVQDIKGWVPNV